MNILINRSDAIGDLVLTLPVVEFLKQHYPQCRITLMVSPRNAFVVEGHPLIDRVIIDEWSQSFFSRVKKLWRTILEEEYTHYFYMGGRTMANWIVWPLISFRGGLRSRLSSFLLLNRGVRQRRSDLEVHEAFYNIQLLAPLGVPVIKLKSSNYPARLFVSENERERAGEILRNLCHKNNLTYPSPFVVVHPGMTGHTLNWAVKNYARFIRQVERFVSSDTFFILSYTASDEPYVAPIRIELQKSEYRALEKRIIWLDGGEIGARAYMAILEKAVLFVGPSTGPIHLANALGVKVVGLYSPIRTQSTLRWGPYNEGGREVLVPDVVCGEATQCVGNECPYYECMPKIEVKEVVNTARHLLSS